MSELENNVSNRTFAELFKHNVQFEIPFFQRGYVWGKPHWDQLFVDIKEQVIPEIDSSTETSVAEQFSDAEHFFGPIVVLEKRNTGLSSRKFSIIDGQQRITTIYLLLAEIKNKLEEKNHQSPQASEYCSELNKYIENELEETNTDDYSKLKVLSSKGDRLPTYSLIFKQNPKTPSLLVDQQLYVPLTNNIDQLRKYLNKKLTREFNDVPALWQLAQILLRSLKIVWIGLEEGKDDPQAIFESLNDRGIPLAASELICNYLFKPLIDSIPNDYEGVHNEYWLYAISKTDISGDFEDYLRINFSIGEKKVIGKGRRIYVHFKNTNKKLTAEKAKSYLKDIKSGIAIYNQIADPIKNKNKNADIANLLIKIKATRMDACNTFILALLKANAIGTINEQITESILRETLTLLVRRKMCELKTTKYDTIFPNMLSHIANEPNPAKAFKDKVLEEEYFVSNQEFENALINKPLYRSRDLAFTRMVLQEIDKSMQSYNQLPDYSTLETVEHVLPQQLTVEWENYIGNDLRNSDLTLYANTLGNLCLLSGPANSHAGQDPFESKRVDYTNVSMLTCDLKTRDTKWNIEAIKRRSGDLSKHALKIWAWSE